MFFLLYFLTLVKRDSLAVFAGNLAIKPQRRFFGCLEGQAGFTVIPNRLAPTKK